MADVKISALTAKPTDAASTDEFPANSAGTTYKITAAQITTGLTYASEAQARAGVATGVVMDPLQVANAIDEMAGGDITGSSNTFTGSNTFNGAFAINGTQAETLAAQADNLTLGVTTNVLNITLTGDQSITGITGGAAGRVVFLTNVDATETLTVVHDATSTAANRFTLPGAKNFSLLPGQSAILKYNGTRWAFVAQTYSVGSGSGDLLSIDGDGSELTNISLPKGYINGGVVTTVTSGDTDHDVDISALVCRNSANTGNAPVAARSAAQCDAIWTQGGPGIMAENGTTGNPVAMPTSGLVYFFAITDGTDFDFCADDNVDGSNIGTAGSATDGWSIVRDITQGRRTNASANFRPVKTFGSGDSVYVSNSDQVGDYTAGTVNTTRTAISVTAPPGTLGVFQHAMSSGNTTYIMLSSLTEDDPTITAQENSDLQSTASGSQAQASKMVLVDANGQIGLKRSGSDVSSTYWLKTDGWWEIRS